MVATSHARDDASGSPRPIGTWETFVVNTIGYAPGLVLVGAPFLLGGLYPNADVYWVLTLGVILSVFNGLTYGLFSTAIDRSGGDLLFIGKTLQPWLGFTCNWGFWWSQILGLGVYTSQCVTDALCPGLTTYGYATGRQELIDMGEHLSGGPWVWGIGCILLVTVYLACVSEMKLLLRLLNGLFLVAFVGTLCMAGVFLTTNREEFIEAFNRFMAEKANLPNAYDAVIALGQARGLKTGLPTDLTSAILALPVGYWVFIGFTYSAYVGSEVRQPQRSQTIGMIGALLSGYVLYLIVLGRYYDVVGRDFSNAIALVKLDPGSPLLGGGSMTFFAGMLAGRPLLSFLISLSTFLWFYLLLFVMALICVRIVQSWSFYGVIPDGLSRPSEKTGQPVRATLLIIVMATAFLTLQVFIGIAFINYIAMFSVCFLITGVAAITFPRRRPDIFGNAPWPVTQSVGGIPLIMIAGIGNVLLFAVVLFSSLTTPALSGVEGLVPSVVLVIVYVAGFLMYVIARRVRRAAGVDLDRRIREE